VELAALAVLDNGLRPVGGVLTELGVRAGDVASSLAGLKA